MQESLNPGLQYLLEHQAALPSPINVCFTSRSSAGAWQIRGQQIASMRSNWRAINKPTTQDLRDSDLICFVKKPDSRVLDKARKYGKPIVFDIVDSWAQPDDGNSYRDILAAKGFFAQAWKRVRADGYIFPTHTMEKQLGGLVPCGATIYHHYWPHIKKNPIRDTVRKVGYEGADYLGEWRSRIEDVCAHHGLEFVVNPSEYTDLDIVIIARGGVHANFLSSNYKSNVKLANAYGSGTPVLAHISEMSVHDTDCGDVMFFSDAPGSLERQLRRLISNYSLRLSIHQEFLRAAKRFEIGHLANQFETFFEFIIKNHDELSQAHR